MYEVNILVNGSRCKQYSHEGKIFIESKEGSEYTIEVKNNTWQRVLTVCSVDGLDILNGKPAKETNSGYVISGYSNGKFDGFRLSDNKVAKFVFDYKNASYAASKKDGSEKNVGVIGVRIFNEKIQPQVTIKTVYLPTTIWVDQTWTNNITGGYGNSITDNSYYPKVTACSCNNETNTNTNINYHKLGMCDMTHEYSSTARGFDMGTKYGEAKESRVVEVEFERGFLAFTQNIYYASRQSLIEMGIHLGNEKQVSFPEPFTDKKYSTPPPGWKG
jgi:hypothetical protein